MQKKKKEKSTHPEKKHKKHFSPSKTHEPQKNSTRKYYGAFKSTHYNPCKKDYKITKLNAKWPKIG